jgi:hypothetical protein
MKISGFTMGKNVTKLYYPVKESILSILPICDEFVIALGDSDADDNTREEILSINSPKIKIIDTVWDIEKYPQGTEMAHQTDIAKEHCNGDWLFYIQADEVVHEKYLPAIQSKCFQYLENKEIEGIILKYKHFWGDYNHHVDTHGWYKNEIRIIRNLPEIHSWRDAQSFRRIPDFDGLNYRQEKDTFKLKVAKVDAYVYHYGWVRPTKYMKSKIKDFEKIQAKTGQQINSISYTNFDYGDMSKVTVFKDTHPAVMKPWLEKFNWQNDLVYIPNKMNQRMPHKHERLKNKVVTFFEKWVFFRPMWEFKNYVLVKKQ